MSWLTEKVATLLLAICLVLMAGMGAVIVKDRFALSKAATALADAKLETSKQQTLAEQGKTALATAETNVAKLQAQIEQQNTAAEQLGADCKVKADAAGAAALRALYLSRHRAATAVVGAGFTELNRWFASISTLSSPQ